MKARDIMDPRFESLKPENTVAQAVERFSEISRTVGRKMFGLMVTDGAGRLAGMLSMYDILLFIQPKHVHIWGEMDDLEPAGLFEELLGKVRRIRVGDIMTTEVVTIHPGTHVLLIVDVMLKKHIRRLPVVEAERVVGVVYISDLFYQLMHRIG